MEQQVKNDAAGAREMLDCLREAATKEFSIILNVLKNYKNLGLDECKYAEYEIERITGLRTRYSWYKISEIYKLSKMCKQSSLDFNPDLIKKIIDRFIDKITCGEDNFIRLLSILNTSPSLYSFIYEINFEDTCSPFTNHSQFPNLQTEFYADGRDCIDSNIIQLCYKMQYVLRNGLQAFYAKCIDTESYSFYTDSYSFYDNLAYCIKLEQIGQERLLASAKKPIQ